MGNFLKRLSFLGLISCSLLFSIDSPSIAEECTTEKTLILTIRLPEIPEQVVRLCKKNLMQPLWR